MARVTHQYQQAKKPSGVWRLSDCVMMTYDMRRPAYTRPGLRAARPSAGCCFVEGSMTHVAKCWRRGATRFLHVAYRNAMKLLGLGCMLSCLYQASIPWRRAVAREATGGGGLARPYRRGSWPLETGNQLATASLGEITQPKNMRRKLRCDHCMYFYECPWRRRHDGSRRAT